MNSGLQKSIQSHRISVHRKFYFEDIGSIDILQHFNLAYIICGLNSFLL